MTREPRATPSRLFLSKSAPIPSELLFELFERTVDRFINKRSGIKEAGTGGGRIFSFGPLAVENPYIGQPHGQGMFKAQ
jgi:hypothetical protein